MDTATLQFVRQRADNRCEYCRLPQSFPIFGFMWSTLLRVSIEVLMIRATWRSHAPNAICTKAQTSQVLTPHR
jgi:hypothetical protein